MGQDMTLFERTKIFSFSIVLFWFGAVSSAFSQASDSNSDGDTGEQYPEIAAQTAEDVTLKDALEAQEARIQAEISLRDTKLKKDFGDVSATGQEGTITADDASKTLFAQLLVFASVDAAAKDISNVLCVPSLADKRVILGDPRDYANLQNSRRVVTYEITALRDKIGHVSEYIEELKLVSDKNLDREIKGADEFASFPIAAFEAIPLIAGQIETVAKLFRTDVTLNSVDVSISDTALQSALVYSVLSHEKPCPNLVNPMSRIRGVEGFNSALSVELTNLRKDLGNMNSAWLAQSLLFEQVKLKDPSDNTVKQITALQAALSARVNALNSAYDTFYKTLTRPADTRPPPIEAFLLLEDLRPDDHFLNITTEKSSALASTGKNFWRGTRLKYAGAVAVSYQLQNSKGEYAAAGLTVKSTCHRAKRSESFAVPDKKNVTGCATSD